MAGDAEPAKLLLPYLQRADELQKHEPLVAYYCRLYAMEKGLKIPQKDRTKTTNALLISLMNQLEKDKKSVTLGPEDSLYVEGFASNVFAKADKQDRAGRADLNTAKTFYASSIFFEILFQFGELQPDIEQKQKYAVWKAAEIRKALKEGRRPVPGPPGDDKDLTVPSSSPTNTYDMGRSESLPSIPPVGDTPLLHPDKDMGRSESFPSNYPGAADVSSQHTTNMTHTSPPPYSSQDYPSSDFHHLPPPPPETHHHHQSYSGEQQSAPPPPLNYHPTESTGPSFSYPNFQTYPSFHDSTFPPAPSHQPSYYQGLDTASYSQQPAPPAPSYSSAQYGAGDANGSQVKPPPAPATAAYVYDSNYQPSVEKITDAHKAARFAVGALAFDDVPVAVDFLRKALELLTNPSAEGR